MQHCHEKIRQIHAVPFCFVKEIERSVYRNLIEFFFFPNCGEELVESEVLEQLTEFGGHGVSEF